LGRDRQVGPADRPARHPEPVERLRAGHLVHQVEVDIQQVGLAVGAAHHMGVPDLARQRASHHSSPLSDGARSSLRLAYRDGNIGTWTILAEWACWIRLWLSSTPSNPAQPRSPSWWPLPG